MGICRSPSTSIVFAKLVNPLLCLIMVIAILYVGQEILKPLAFSAFIALLLISPCAFFERQGCSRAIAALICLLLALLVFVIVFYFISNSIASFRSDLPLMMDNIDESIHQLEIWIHDKFDVSRQEVHKIVANSTDKVLPSTSSIVNQTFTTVTNLFFIGIIIFIITFLLLLYRGLILLFFIKLFDEKYTEKINVIFSKIRFVTKSYIVGLLIEMIIVAVAYCGVLFFLGVKYALLLGVIGAILNIIPYLGIFLACVLSALITLTTNTPSTVVWVVVSLIIIHMLDSNILMTKIVGSKVKLNALTTIVGVITGSAIWGIPGTFMAVPILAIMKVTFEEIEAFHPFAILMGDDSEVKSFSRPVINKIAKRVSGKKS
ncbi:MAG TPA: AI-2E family transporter [Flavitalea sp.]|nr:AI-2E family transporter [Flavitalea sp.]